MRTTYINMELMKILGDVHTNGGVILFLLVYRVIPFADKHFVRKSQKKAVIPR